MVFEKYNVIAKNYEEKIAKIKKILFDFKEERINIGTLGNNVSKYIMYKKEGIYVFVKKAIEKLKENEFSYEKNSDVAFLGKGKNIEEIVSKFKRKGILLEKN